jgi:hypothetical protein
MVSEPESTLTAAEPAASAQLSVLHVATSTDWQLRRVRRIRSAQ